MTEFYVAVHEDHDSTRVAHIKWVAYAFDALDVFSIGGADPLGTIYLPTLNLFKKSMADLGAEIVPLEISEDAQQLDDSYIHPARAVYVIGRQTGTLPLKEFDQQPLAISTPDMRALPTTAVAGIVLHDRVRKSES